MTPPPEKQEQQQPLPAVETPKNAVPSLDQSVINPVSPDRVRSEQIRKFNSDLSKSAKLVLDVASKMTLGEDHIPELIHIPELPRTAATPARTVIEVVEYAK